jgi:hypothetical protein
VGKAVSGAGNCEYGDVGVDVVGLGGLCSMNWGCRKRGGRGMEGEGCSNEGGKGWRCRY